MIRSKYFWAGAILLAIIPMLLLDISEHYIAWQKEVREPVIDVVQNYTDLPRQQKAVILDNVFQKNETLITSIAFKSFFILVFLSGGIYLLIKYAKAERPSFTRPVLTGFGLMVILMAGKVLLAMAVNTQPGAKIVTVDAGETSFKSIINKNFKGKVVYVDFWGTTCGPCLEEFDNFTHPLKEHYKNRGDIAYLYIANGNRYLWKKQIAAHKITGDHLFLEYAEYDKLFREAVNDANAHVSMPRYVIVDKSGNVSIPDAARPSSYTLITAQLDENLK